MRGRLLLISVIFISTCIGIFMATAFLLVVRPINFEAPNAITTEAEVSFAIEIISADPIARTITAEWYPTYNTDCTENPSKVVDIYVDPGVLDISSPAFGISPPYLPIYHFNVTAYCLAQTSTIHAFQITSKMLNSKYVAGFSGPPQSTLQNYPFDIYYAPMSLYGLDPSNGEYVTLNITRAFGGAVNFKIDLETSGFLGQWLYYNLRVKRSQATKTFVIIVGMTNWLMACAFMTICCATLVYRSHQIYSEMFVVPVGSVFAFTTIRAGFPGAPSGFGATIDLFTILPVLVIMSLCSFFLLLAILHRRIVEFRTLNLDAESQESSFQQQARPRALARKSSGLTRSSRSTKSSERTDRDLGSICRTKILREAELKLNGSEYGALDWL